MKKYNKLYLLTDREKQIFELIIKGYDISEITKKLGIVKATIKTTLSKVYQKLEVAYYPVATVRTKAIIKYLVDMGELDKKWVEN